MNQTFVKKRLNKQIWRELFVFIKAQMSSLIGGITDYFIMIFFTEVFHIHFTISIIIGGVIGAIVNFTINKSWTFFTKEATYSHSAYIQLFRFTIVVLNSILLKSYGTYLATIYIYRNYKIDRIIIDFIISLGCNFPLQKYWVFKKIMYQNIPK